MYCIIKVGSEYYSGLTPRGKCVLSADITDAKILDQEDAKEVVSFIGVGKIIQLVLKEEINSQAGIIEQFIDYAKRYGFTVTYTMAAYAVAECGANFESCLQWTRQLNEALQPAVKAVCKKVFAKPQDAAEQLLVDGPTDAAGFMARVENAVVALWGVHR